MKTIKLFSVLLTFAIFMLSLPQALAERGEGREVMENFRRRVEQKRIENALKKSKNPHATKATLNKVVDDLARNDVNFNGSSVKSMLALMAQKPDVVCSFGKRLKGTKTVAYAELTGGYGANCVSPTNSTKPMFFAGVPAAALRSLKLQGSTNVYVPPTTAADAYIAGNQETLNETAPASQTQQTAFVEPVAVVSSPTAGTSTTVSQPVQSVPVNHYPTNLPVIILPTSSSGSGTVVSSTAQ